MSESGRIRLLAFERKTVNMNIGKRLIVFVLSGTCLIILVTTSSLEAELRGRVESIGPRESSIGDMVDIVTPVHEGMAVFDLGDWKSTDVRGDIAEAKVETLELDIVFKSQMLPVIHISSSRRYAGEGGKGDREKTPSRSAKGKVIMTRGNHITIGLSEGEPAVSKGDAVELSYLVDDIAISVGKWRIQRINENGTLEAEPVEAKGQPTIGMDALVFTGTPKKAGNVTSGKTVQNQKTMKGVGKNRASQREGVTDTEPEKKKHFERQSPLKNDSKPINIEEELALYSRTDMTKNFQALGKSTPCTSGKVRIYANKIEVTAKGGPKSDYCTLKMSDGVLRDFHATLKVSIDITRHDDFKVGMIYGDGIKVLRERNSDSILTTLSLMGNKVSTGFLKSRTDLVSWIDARRTFKDGKRSQTIFDEYLPNTRSNPTPGTLEWLKIGENCRIFYNGEEIGSWDETFVSEGQLWLAFSPVTKGKATAVFENIKVYSLHGR